MAPEPEDLWANLENPAAELKADLARLAQGEEPSDGRADVLDRSRLEQPLSERPDDKERISLDTRLEVLLVEVPKTGQSLYGSSSSRDGKSTLRGVTHLRNTVQ